MRQDTYKNAKKGFEFFEKIQKRRTGEVPCQFVSICPEFFKHSEVVDASV